MGRPGQVAPVEDDLAGVRLDHADRHAEAGGLARLAEQADDLGFVDVEGHPGHDGAAGVVLPEVLGLQQVHAGKDRGSGQWAVGSGQWAVGSGQWTSSGQWAVGSGQWAVGFYFAIKIAGIASGRGAFGLGGPCS